MLLGIDDTNNKYLQVGSKIFYHVIGISMGSDPEPLFVNLVLSIIESK